MQWSDIQMCPYPNRKDLSTTNTFTLSTRRKKTTVSKLQMVVEEKGMWSRKAEKGLMLVSELDIIRSFLFGDQLTAIFLAFLACALFLCDLPLFPFSDLAGPERVRTLDQMNHCGWSFTIFSLKFSFAACFFVQSYYSTSVEMWLAHMSQKKSHPLENGTASWTEESWTSAESLLFWWFVSFVFICYSLEARVKRQKEWDEQQRRIQLVRAWATPLRWTALDAWGCLEYLALRKWNEKIRMKLSQCRRGAFFCCVACDEEFQLHSTWCNTIHPSEISTSNVYPFTSHPEDTTTRRSMS